MQDTVILHVSEGMLSDTISARTLILARHHLRSCRCDPLKRVDKRLQVLFCACLWMRFCFAVCYILKLKSFICVVFTCIYCMFIEGTFEALLSKEKKARQFQTEMQAIGI